MKVAKTGDAWKRDNERVRKTTVVAATLIIGMAILAGCTNGSASVPSTRFTVTDSAVCNAFNTASSPLFHLDSAETTLGRLAAKAKNRDIRRSGGALVRYRDAAAIEGSRPFAKIGAVCVSLGLTPSDWAELI
jgi:hypothetical protein